MTAAPIEAQVDQGGRLSLALSLGGPQFQVFQRQALWEGPLGDRPTVRDSPQEAGRPDPPSVQRAEGRSEVRALAIGNMGPSVLERGAFKDHRGLEGPACSPALNDRRRPSGPGGSGVAALVRR